MSTEVKSFLAVPGSIHLAESHIMLHPDAIKELGLFITNNGSLVLLKPCKVSQTQIQHIASKHIKIISYFARIFKLQTLFP